MDSQPELTPQARELAEHIIALGRKNGISPEAQRELFLGDGMGAGKTSAQAVTLAQLDAASTPYEKSDDGHGNISIRIRPAGAEPTEE